MLNRSSSTSIAALAAILLLGKPALSADVSNSTYFQISDYKYPNASGDFIRYTAHGFVEKGGSASKRSVFILPTLYYDPEELVFTDERGKSFDPKKHPDIVPRSIRIKINRQAQLPDDQQKPAFSAAISQGTAIHNYYPPLPKDGNGNPLIFPPTTPFPAYVQAIHDAYKGYEKLRDQQQATVNAFQNFVPEMVDLTGLSISVSVDNETIATVDYDGSFVSSSNKLASIDVVRPDEYTFNRIREGNFGIRASYKFRDEKTGYIDANFDASRVVREFISQVQQSTVESKESGWKFLGIGSRRKTLRQTFNEEIEKRHLDNTVDNTVIEIFDADDDMIKQFEAKAFPKLSQDEVISAHLDAAKDTSLSDELRKIHADYARALQEHKIDLETDIAGAAAALAMEDYASFLAKGVRFGDEKMSGNYDFRRVVDQNVEISKITNWLQTRTVSLQHALIADVDKSESGKSRAWLGLCDALPINWQTPITNPWGIVVGMKNDTFLLLTCVHSGGPLTKAGFMPGEIITAIGGQAPPQSAQDLEDLIGEYDPGDTMRITTFSGNQANPYRTRNVQLGTFPL